MKKPKTRDIALLGMLFALAIALSYLESLLAPMLGLMPAMKLGLSNLIVMYALLFLNTGSAAALVLLKALFAFLTRGMAAGFLSLCGGALSLLVLVLLLHFPRGIGGYIFTVSGALAHNLGQLFGATYVLYSTSTLSYAPVLLVAGVVVGALSCLLARALFPALARALPQYTPRRDIFGKDR